MPDKLLEEFLANAAFGLAGDGRAVRRVRYSLLGCEPLDDVPASASLLKSLSEEDWAAAGTHRRFDVEKDAFMGYALRFERADGSTSDYWLAVKNPFELYEGPSVICHQDVRKKAPDADWKEIDPVFLNACRAKYRGSRALRGWLDRLRSFFRR